MLYGTGSSFVSTKIWLGRGDVCVNLTKITMGGRGVLLNLNMILQKYQIFCNTSAAILYQMEQPSPYDVAYRF